MKRILFFLIVILLVACETDELPPPESDSDQYYEGKARIPVDDNVYEIEGVVAGVPDSLVRQTQAARGYVVDGSGSYFGAQLSGKGFVTLMVESVQPQTDTAEVGSLVILKTTDTKAVKLLPGYRVKFKCRRQYEAVAAVRNMETFDSDKLATWELDYCRMADPKAELTEGR